MMDLCRSVAYPRGTGESSPSDRKKSGIRKNGLGGRTTMSSLEGAFAPRSSSSATGQSAVCIHLDRPHRTVRTAAHSQGSKCYVMPAHARILGDVEEGYITERHRLRHDDRRRLLRVIQTQRCVLSPCFADEGRVELGYEGARDRIAAFESTRYRPQ